MTSLNFQLTKPAWARERNIVWCRIYGAEQLFAPKILSLFVHFYCWRQCDWAVSKNVISPSDQYFYDSAMDSEENEKDVLYKALIR